VLIAVYVAMTAHVLHWAITGRSFGRFVMSDSMRTLELGEINPGFVLFALAILTTLLLGRFMCGWLCHLGGLQDLAAWLLRRAGVRPHLFRSRVLGWAPVALAAYMFVWPTAAREVVAPVLRPTWPGVDRALEVRPFPGFSASWTTEGMWDGLPSLWVGIPFLLVCGFATVWFLGARGLCRYACPYGGLLLPAEHLSVGQVTVDPARCDQCGLCTAACTAGVRVHDQVREFGRVKDINCIRSLDCVAACPSGALSLRAGRPGSGGRAGPATAHPKADLTWPEEIGCLAVFLLVLLTVRGLYDYFPLLMSAPIAIIAAYAGWKAWRLVRDEHVRMGGAVLKRHGRLTPVGRPAVGLMVLAAGLVAQSVVVRGLLWAAGREDDQVTVSRQAAAQGQVPEEQRVHATRALRLYRLAGPIGRGGVGLADTPGALVRTAWLGLVLGNPQGAVDDLTRLVDSGRANDAIGPELAGLLAGQGRAGDAERVLRRVLEDHGRFEGTRDALARLLLEQGRAEEAEGVYAAALANGKRNTAALAGLGRLYMLTGRVEEGLATLARAAWEAPGEPGARRDYAIALFTQGRVDEAVRELESAAGARPAARRQLLGVAASMLHEAGRESAAAEMARRAER
jgi:tetratricopeptide (TPR) repeat protein/ferredoxin